MGEDITKKACKPKWWTDSLESSWNSVKGDVVADWKKVVESEKKVVREIDEQALAFGHGARQIYQKVQAWGEELEDKLKADWKETAADAGQTWDQVRAAIKRGWERATGSAPSSKS